MGMENRDAVRALKESGVDPEGLVDFTEFIFEDPSDDGSGMVLTFAAFMEVVLQFRGSNTVTVKDFVELRKWIASTLQQELKYFRDRFPSHGGTKNNLEVVDPSRSKDLVCKSSLLKVDGAPHGSKEKLQGTDPLPYKEGVMKTPLECKHKEVYLTLGRLEAFLVASDFELRRFSSIDTWVSTGSEDWEQAAKDRVQEFLLLHSLIEVEDIREHMKPPRNSVVLGSLQKLRVWLVQVEKFILCDVQPHLSKMLECKDYSWIVSVTESLSERLNELEQLRDGFRF